MGSLCPHQEAQGWESAAQVRGSGWSWPGVGVDGLWAAFPGGCGEEKRPRMECWDHSLRDGQRK